jgi:uncharacterized protein (UPF0332 family)
LGLGNYNKSIEVIYITHFYPASALHLVCALDKNKEAVK